jgi:hypothetical protein
MSIRLPPLKIGYLEALTDDTGVFQHAKYCIPKRNEGYTTDDNARALIVCTKYQRLKNDPQARVLANIYLAFLNHMQKPDGNFHNYLSYERSFLDVDGSEDCIGRALWSCGCAINSTLPDDMKRVAKEIFDRGLPWVWKLTSLRFYAFTLMGLSEYFRAIPDDNLKVSAEKLADSLIQHYQDEVKDGWRWFEPNLTYDNARLPQALLAAYMMVGKQKYLYVAKESMDFLLKTQMVNDVFVPIGNHGWYKRGGKRAFYDQQPLEATAMVEAAVDAFYATKDKGYVEVANMVFEWFLGRNSQKVMVYNPQIAGCFDGISPQEVNMNQGAESSISYLLARLKVEELTGCLKAEENQYKNGCSKTGQINVFER